ncbi:unknown [Coprobacillus sp. CAG:605]|nr:unknown [Coprobacillus sp. CAG:605]
MDEILQMYVYIPRYRYKLFNANNGTSKEQAIDIIFEKVGTEKSNGMENGEWLTHPAFTFGNAELPGIWVGKFEASGTTDNYTIKPNQKSLTNINISTMFNTSRTATTTKTSIYGTNSSTSDSHMIKNIEWGAAAYLANSIYGRYSDISTCIESGCEVWINNISTGVNNGPSITGCSGPSVSAASSNSQTSCASGYDWKTKGVNASTTGNQYGIYDMSGGAWEYVMGVQKDANGNVEVAYSGFSVSNFPNSKYYDLYDYQAESGVGYSRYHLGDATKEILKNNLLVDGSYAWWNDLASCIYKDNSFVGRSGHASVAENAGIFRFSTADGYGYPGNSFRSVLTAS